ncbi:DNA-binding LacI/PurR family transcriptional regulator [Spirilliplanes yamanashiensis]|nr:DNA-binding LacI/PurR family transcriptional regulator [Spirilliplanes yamanashiensis]
MARRAGVSRATVSRVVNGSTTVAEAIREAVNQAVDELGYVPNQAARSLVTQRTDSIALILPEAASRVFSDDQFFASIVWGVSAELESADKQLVLMMAGSSASHDRVERYAMAGHVDGVMFASIHGADPLPGALARLGIPVVCGGRPLAPADEASIPYVDVDHSQGIAAAMSRLLEQGRRRIATIAGPQDMVAGQERLQAFRAAVPEEHRSPVVSIGAFTRESGADAMRQLLERDPRVDAVFCASDLMAHGAIAVLKQHGRRVPDDVSIVGFDDIEISKYSDPALTTVRQPSADIGKAMARQMLHLIKGEVVSSSLVLPTELIVRASA